MECAEPYEAQEAAEAASEELGIQCVSSPNIVSTAEAGYIFADDARAAGYEVSIISIHRLPSEGGK